MKPLTKPVLRALFITWAVVVILWLIVLIRQLMRPGDPDWSYLSIVIITILAGVLNIITYARLMRK
jgi:hypothetical protein